MTLMNGTAKAKRKEMLHSNNEMREWEEKDCW